MYLITSLSDTGNNGEYHYAGYALTLKKAKEFLLKDFYSVLDDLDGTVDLELNNQFKIAGEKLKSGENYSWEKVEGQYETHSIEITPFQFTLRLWDNEEEYKCTIHSGPDECHWYS